ncbi:MAG: 2-oxoacid:acceptor oxidoreductase family protein, partial [Propionibacteriaceae bacterium]
SELGNLKFVNMVMLGAFVEATKAVKPESILDALEHKLGVKKAHLMEGNRAAFAKGAEVVRDQLAAWV